ncbi:hypothetical protein C8J57DRAFT_1251316 [Mycena rebaudengoi]|nr:hypothetical protein C8J57DRAFT_1251316 [Mycena rebaudengoi]
MPPKDAANWTTNPEDITNLLAFFHRQRSRVGEGGNWDKTVLNEAATYMAGLGPPAKGGPKTAAAIATKWGQIRKIFEAILQMKQKVYPGASGWTYTDNGGFNKVQVARKLALDDMNSGYITSDERVRLSILFGRDNTAADAYIADEEPFLRAEIARELLNPTQNFGF